MSTIKVNNIVPPNAGEGVSIDGLQMPTAGALSNRSLIINGGMTVAQRGTSVASTADGQYLIDRFKLYDAAANSHTITQSQSSDVPSGSTTSFAKALKLEVTSGAATPAAGYTVIAQGIEGFNSAQLKYGTADAKTVTLSFWARTNAGGTYSIVLRNNATDRYYISQYTLVSNTWTYITVTVSGDTAGTWLTDNSLGLQVMWALDVGTDFHGTTGTWGAGLKFGAAADTNTWSDTTGNTFELTGVQLEVGSKATSFEHRSYGDELAKCQRYYYDNPNTIHGAVYGSGNSMVHVYLQTIMRADPSTFVYTATTNTGTHASDYVKSNYCRAYYTGDTSIHISAFKIDAEL